MVLHVYILPPYGGHLSTTALVDNVMSSQEWLLETVCTIFTTQQTGNIKIVVKIVISMLEQLHNVAPMSKRHQSDAVCPKDTYLWMLFEIRLLNYSLC